MGAHFWPTFFDTISCTFLISPSGWKQTWSEASVGYYSEANVGYCSEASVGYCSETSVSYYSEVSVGYYTVPVANALIMTTGKSTDQHQQFG